VWNVHNRAALMVPALRRLWSRYAPRRREKGGFAWSVLTPVVLVGAGARSALSARPTAQAPICANEPPPGTDEPHRPAQAELGRLAVSRRRASLPDRASKRAQAVRDGPLSGCGPTNENGVTRSGRLPADRRARPRRPRSCSTTRRAGPTLPPAPWRGAPPPVDDLVFTSRTSQAVVTRCGPRGGGDDADGRRVISTSAVRCVETHCCSTARCILRRSRSPPSATRQTRACARRVEGVRLFSEAADTFGLFGYESGWRATCTPGHSTARPRCAPPGPGPSRAAAWTTAPPPRLDQDDIATTVMPRIDVSRPDAPPPGTPPPGTPPPGHLRLGHHSRMHHSRMHHSRGAAADAPPRPRRSRSRSPGFG